MNLQVPETREISKARMVRLKSAKPQNVKYEPSDEMIGLSKATEKSMVKHIPADYNIK